MLHKKQIASILGVAALGIFSVFAQKQNASEKYIPEKYTGAKFKMPANVPLNEFMEKTIIAKVKPDLKYICNKDLINNTQFAEMYAAIGGYNLAQSYPHSEVPTRKYNDQGEEYVDLTLVYEFKYTAEVSLEKAINKFLQLGIFQYVEPHFIPHLYLTPNDANYSQQWHLTKIKANQAWDVTTGSTSVVIGITDTGIDFTHPDLQANLYTNTADPVGGGDQDNDGYLDNYRGWDVGMNDNDPTWEGNNHGVHVTGIAAASTNNSIGVAGVGFNCKYMPIKIADASGALVASYAGITYAADHGCDIINCSWGGTYGGQAGQDVITYASINKNCLVVCAAGNGGNEDNGYPASFKYAFSVANTQSSDILNSSSQWGYNIDVCAPGTSILATYPGTYGYATGTSMASPVTAGAAAIVKSQYPTYNGLQVGERLRTTCDNINSVNGAKVGKIGGGRINLYKAVSDPLNSPSVAMTSRTETDGNDNAFVIGDTISITGIFTNYLAPTTNLTATISTTLNLYTTITDNLTTLGAIPTMGTKNSAGDPWKIYIKPNAPTNLAIDVKVTYADGAYSKVEWFKVTINVDYINIAVNDVGTTLTSNGGIGYRDDAQVGGLGFTYKGGQTVLYEAGLMVARDSSVSDRFRGMSAGGDKDFSSVKNASKILPAVKSDFDAEATIKDNLALNPLPIQIHQKAFAWTTAPFRKFVIMEYVIYNTGTSTLNNLYAGIAADWDIDGTTFKDNRAEFDAPNKMGYSYHTATNGIYAGVKLLTKNAPVNHYAIDNGTGFTGVDMSDGYSGDEKFTTMSTSRTIAGQAGTGNDVLQVVSTGPLTINAGDSTIVAFALIAGDDLSDMQSSAGNAQIKYDGLYPNGINDAIAGVSNVRVFPNPTAGTSNVQIELENSSMVELALFNVLGEKMATLTSEKLSSGVHQFSYETNNLAAGVYYYNLTVNGTSKTIKMIVSK